jgi:hypothetical protein
LGVQEGARVNTVTLWLTNTVPETCVFLVLVLAFTATYWTLTDPRHAWARRRELVGVSLRSLRWIAPAVLGVAAVWFGLIDQGRPAYDVVGSWCWDCSEWLDGIMETLQNSLQMAFIGFATAVSAVLVLRAVTWMRPPS